MVVEEVKTSSTGRAGNSGCGIVSGSTGRTASDSVLTGYTLFALKGPKFSISAGVAGVVVVVAGGASSDEEVAGDTGVGPWEGISQTLAADHIKTSIVSSIASRTTSNFGVAKVARKTKAESKRPNRANIAGVVVGVASSASSDKVSAGGTSVINKVCACLALPAGDCQASFINSNAVDTVWNEFIAKRAESPIILFVISIDAGNANI